MSPHAHGSTSKLESTTEARVSCNQPPPIIFGTSALGNLFQELDDQTKQGIVAQWFQSCGKQVAADSAGKYGAGLALESMAASLKTLNIDPDQVLISNKLGWRRVPLKTPEPTFEPGAWVNLKYDAVQDISYDGILRCYEQGCELLDPYVPQWVSVHDPDEYLAAACSSKEREERMEDILGAYRALGELREAGRVTAIGVGSKDWRVSQEICEQCTLDWVMLATSLTIYTHSPEVLAFVEQCHRDSIRVVNSAVFHSGFLTGGNHFDYREVVGNCESDRKLIHYREKFETVCRSHNVSPAQACVSFGMSPPGVDAIALNSSRASRVEENVSLVQTSLPDKFWSAMKDAGMIDSQYPYVAS
ncbi:MAG: aldo/keto reductase [Planctomycetota bacterium]